MSIMNAAKTSKRTISSDRVENVPVLGSDGKVLGKIIRLLIDRAGGNVTSAIVLRRTQFGFGSEVHEVPWNAMWFEFATNCFKTDLRKCDPVRSFVESDKIEGMELYDQCGRAVGTIKRMLIDKISGNVECAVVVHHGRLGIHSVEYSVAWRDLRFDQQLSGYRILDNHALRPVERGFDA